MTESRLRHDRIEAQPGLIEAQPGLIEAQLGLIEAQLGLIEAQLGHIEANTDTSRPTRTSQGSMDQSRLYGPVKALWTRLRLHGPDRGSVDQYRYAMVYQYGYAMVDLPGVTTLGTPAAPPLYPPSPAPDPDTTVSIAEFVLTFTGFPFTVFDVTV